ncbi:hypothetical protein D3C72_2036460 [compost metagenome]
MQFDALLRKPGSSLGAIEDRYAEGILQLLDPFGNRRLRHVQFGGGGLETAQLDNPVNGFDLLQGDHVYYLGTAAVYGEWDSDCPLKAII